MGFRLRRSIKIMPGVRMTVSARGLGLSMGVPGARMSVNTHGRVTRSVGIPGSGVSYVKTSSRGGPRSAPQPSRANALPMPPPRPVTAAPALRSKPGLFAPGWQKELYRASASTPPIGATFQALAAANPAFANTIAFAEALRVSMPANDHARSRILLNQLFDASYDPRADAVANAFFGRVTVSVPIAEGLDIELAFADRTTLGLILSEIEESIGSPDRAIHVAESLEPTTITAASLADLYADDRRWDEIVTLTDGVTNEDNPSVYLLTQRGIAFRQLERYDAARQSFTEALRIRSRSAPLRHLAFIERGKAALCDGQKALARKDFERVLAEDSSYEGLAELLASLDGSAQPAPQT
jgi:tetratricopeptide (TPR) repeat protein